MTPEEEHQTWRGVGAALTDASVEILESSPAATALLFEPGRLDGAWLNLVRLPLSATDFSTTPWTFDWDDGAGALTPTQQARAATGFLTDELVPLRDDLSVIAVPWSAPAAMKDPATMNGGSLRADSVAAYGRLLVAQADWLGDRGVPLSALSLGNEPFHSAAGNNGYPTMLMSDAQQIALGRQVGRQLTARNVELWAVDHNWDHRSHYDTVLEGAPGMFDSSAFHCYGGSPGQMDDVAAPPIVTECTGTNDSYTGTFRWDAANLVVGAVNAGSTGLLMWNLALDESHGPHTGGCGTCRGVVDVHSVTGAVSPTPEFYTLAHVSRAADPGAVVIGSGFSPGIPYVAFRNPDGELGVVGHNDTGVRQVLSLAVDGESTTVRVPVGPGELFTVRGVPAVVSGSVMLPSGAPRVGIELASTVTGFGTTMLSYQWLADGVQISGATASAITPTLTHVGARLALRVTGSRPGFRPAVVTSSLSDPVVAAEASLIENTMPPVITGVPRVGVALSATQGSWMPEEASVSYQWLAAGSPIAGASSSSDTPSSVDVGKPIMVEVTASKAGYSSGSASSVATTNVMPGRLMNTIPPVITGDPVVGVTLSGSTPAWSPPAASLAYQWLRGGVPVAGSTGPSYTVRSVDLGERIGLQVTAWRPGYESAQAAATETGPVTSDAVVNLEPPQVTGSAKVGAVLAATGGSWSPTGVARSYEWFADGASIPHARSPS